MPGPHEKQGLEYFPHDVDLSNDEKIELLEASEGLIGYAVFSKILERIYRHGYFIQADDKFIRLFSKRNNIEINVCNNIINVCINENLFDRKIFEQFKILTSKGIQERYIDAVKRRKRVELIKQYLLINVNGKADNVDIISINVGNNKQSRVEKSRVEKSTVEKTPRARAREDDVFDEFWEAYPKKVGKGAAQKSWKKIRAPEETLKLILDALLWQRESDQWTKQNGQFIPNPSTYLNQRRWEDEPKTKDDRFSETTRKNIKSFQSWEPPE